MSRPIVTSVTIDAAVATAVALSQTLGAAGNLTLNGSLVSGGVATLDAPRRIVVAGTGDNSGITFTITGAGRPQNNGGAAISETITGADDGSASTTQDFATVTKVSSSGAITGNVTVGTSGTASGPWVPWSGFQTDFQATAFGHVLSGSPTWQVDYTRDDVFGTWLPPGQPFPIAIPVPGTQGTTGDLDATIPAVARASRLTLTAPGGVQLTSMQQGI
jgi:hypothetical protein